MLFRSSKQALSLWAYYETSTQKESLDGLIQAFNEAQEQYSLSWTYVPMTDFSKRLSMGITEDQLPDLVIMDNPDMATYIQLGLLEPLNQYWEMEEIKEGYYPNIWRSVEYEGDYYGLPFCCNNLALIYNQTLFEEAGRVPPTTWEAFLECADYFTTELRFGFAMSAATGEQAAFQVMPWILSEGDVVKAFDKLHSLIALGYLDRNCINWSQNDVARLFVEGKVAMMENGPWILPMLEESGINYGIVPLPISKQSMVLTGGENLCVIQDKNIEGALAFLDFYRQPEVMIEACEQASSLPPTITEAMNFGKGQYDVFIQQMEWCVARNSFDNWKTLSSKLSESIYNLFTGSMTSEMAAQHLQ